MTATEIRALTGLSRVDFCKYYGIPYRSMENWERGIRVAPEYVMRLLERCVRIDFECSELETR